MSDWGFNSLTFTETLDLANQVEKSKGLDITEFNQRLNLSFFPTFLLYLMTGPERDKERLSRKRVKKKSKGNKLLSYFLGYLNQNLLIIYF